jgi:hypothetical protein
VHLAGGRAHRGYWLDAHSGSMPEAVFAFARDLLPDLPNLRLVNFELMPAFLADSGEEALAAELERRHELWSTRRMQPAGFPTASDAARVPTSGGPDPLA